MEQKLPDVTPAASEVSPRWPGGRLVAVTGDLLRYFMLLPVLATFVTGIALVIYGLGETRSFIEALFFSDEAMDRNHVQLLAIEIVDLYLLATVIEVVSLGLFQLHFNQDLAVPKWLKITSIDDLKSKLASVAVTVLGVYFLGRAVVSEGGPDILYLGGGSALIMAALSYFLSRFEK